jgi:hypothetical protein
MKTTQIYLLAIGLLMYMSYSAHRDEYKQKQQEAHVHKLYCSENPTNSSCKWNSHLNREKSSTMPSGIIR